MTSIVTSILSSTLGLLWNKAGDATAENLENGDVTDGKLRKIVVRELNDIKTKLDCPSRKDLLSSYTYLKEGVQLLNDSLDKSKDEQTAVMNEDKDDGSVTSCTMPSGGDILSDALQLSQAMGRLKVESNQSGMAEERFKEARKQATLAFCDKALSIQDRIFATNYVLFHKYWNVSNVLTLLLLRVCFSWKNFMICPPFVKYSRSISVVE